MKAPIVLSPGAPGSFVIPWADQVGPVNLTGFTASCYVVGQALQGARADLVAACTATITQANPGRVTVRIAWNDTWLPGPLGWITVRVHPSSGDPQATLPIGLYVGSPD